MTANDNFIGSGRESKQLFSYILDYRIQKHQPTVLRGAHPHIISEFCYRTPKILLHWVPSVSYMKLLSLTHFRGFSSKNLCYTGRKAVRDVRNGYITKYIGEDIERVFRFTWRKWWQRRKRILSEICTNMFTLKDFPCVHSRRWSSNSAWEVSNSSGWWPWCLSLCLPHCT